MAKTNSLQADATSRADSSGSKPSESQTRLAALSHLILRPSIKRQANGIYVFVLSVTDPPPAGPLAFRSISGPFATEATALESLRRMLRMRMQAHPEFVIEVDGRNQTSIEAALRALSAKTC